MLAFGYASRSSTSAACGAISFSANRRSAARNSSCSSESKKLGALTT